MEAKTEQPTDKKKRDSAKKGQIYKSADLTTLVSTFVVAGFVYLSVDLLAIFGLLDYLSSHAYDVPLNEVVKRVFISFAGIAACLVGVTLLIVPLATLLQTRFSLASEVLKPSLSPLNPIQGFKKLFSLRTLKDAFKALLYFTTFAMGGWTFWQVFKQRLFSLVRADIPGFIQTFSSLVLYLVLFYLLFSIVVVLLDALVEFFLVNRDLKMTKQEVKRERKDTEGKPEIKSQRQKLARELLSAQQKSDVANSNFVLANPTHIAIGIFYAPDINECPFVSLVATNAVAKAVVAYAEKVGTPVVRDIPLARAMYKHVRRYDFVNPQWIEEVLRILAWLAEVERAGQAEALEDQTIRGDS
ncbi:EscU/YscU/HrcU family type III secretion system export apparatus switch protein [Pseudomonas batumici]|uniref:EscU/YscU/HrcU family type III secretion system export apparatus switch protein n=1 Tax=Pseudomonas batumici TaxID=226910 RepID=UPI0030D62227